MPASENGCSASGNPLSPAAGRTSDIHNNFNASRNFVWCMLFNGRERMKKFAAMLIFCATALSADNVETAYFRGTMLPANETPPVPIQGSSSATLIAHIVRDNSGKIVSGSVDFEVGYAFPGAATITG